MISRKLRLIITRIMIRVVITKWIGYSLASSTHYSLRAAHHTTTQISLKYHLRAPTPDPNLYYPDMPHHRPHDRPPLEAAAATTLVSRHATLVSLRVDAELFNPPRPEWRTASRSRPGPSALSTERWRQNRILHGYQDRLDSISPSVQKSTMRTFREAPSPHGVQL